MKSFSSGPFSSVVIRRLLSVATSVCALAISTSAFADEQPAEPVAAAEAAPTTESTESTEKTEKTEKTETVTETTTEKSATAEKTEAPATATATTTTAAAAPRFSSVSAAPPVIMLREMDRPSAAPPSPSTDTDRFRIGALVGIGFPRPLAVEGFAKFDRLIGVGVEYSFLPRMNLLGADTSFKAVAADLRVFPFRNSFFIGARAGRQWLDAKTTVKAGPVESLETMDAATWFINPRIGFLHTFQSGITVGIDAGVQIPINATYARTSGVAAPIPGALQGVDDTLAGVANALGNKTTPTIDLLRVGFLF